MSTSTTSTADASSEKAPRKKPGNRGDFHGARETFLNSQMPEYARYSRDGKTRQFWPGLFKEYWAKFPWRIPLTVDPDEDTVVDNSASSAEAEEKAKVTQDVTKKIKTWYNNHRGANGLQSNAFTEWLTRLRVPGSAPRRPADWQHYMKMPEYRDRVNDLFEERYPLKGPEAARKALNQRGEVARELFDDEPDTVKTAVHTAADNAHAALLAKYNAGIRGEISEDPEDQRLARLQFSSMVAPLLEGLRAHTGYYITLIAACRVGDEMDVITLNEGKTKGETPVDFAQWDEEAYRTKVLDHFVRYVLAAEKVGEPEGAAAVSAAGAGAGPITTTQSDTASTPAAGTVVMPPATATTAVTRTTAQPSTAPPHPSTPPRFSTPPRWATPSDPPEPPSTPPPRPDTPPAPPPRTLIEILADEKNAYETDDEFPGPKLHRALREELRAQTPNTRKARHASLLRMTEDRRICENNMARNRWLLRDVVGEDPLAEDKQERREKRGREEKKQERARKKARRDGGEDDEGDWEESSDDEDDNEGEDGGEEDKGQGPMERRVQPARGTRGTAASKTTGGGAIAARAVAADRVGVALAPMWAQNARAVLEEIAGGTTWTALIELWWALEERNAFESPPKGPRGANRPKQVGDWVQRARIGTPRIPDLKEFVNKWWAWWTSINPSWRRVNGKLVQEGTGPWTELEFPGPNGFLNVVVCLKWWRGKLAEGNEEWEKAVSDVSWVLSQMLR
ncbi:hypothetical protein B0H11DRAFT_2214638 [Mycena galericulata]|nr:hypothetical protein B0H11DRAFT_2214638 [Mycena galericulata]